MDQNFKKHIISIQDFQRKFYDSKEPDSRVEAIKRKPELVQIIKELEPNFGNILKDAYKYFTTYTGKGEINVTFGTKVELTYFPLSGLRKMADGSTGGVKADIEYSINRINNKHDKRIPFVVWDPDGRTYHYEFNTVKNEIEFEAVLKGKTSDDDAEQAETDDILEKFKKLLALNSLSLEKFFEKYESEVDIKGKGIYSVQINPHVSAPYSGFEMIFVSADDLRDMHNNEKDPDERERLDNIINNLWDFETQEGYFLSIIDFDGSRCDLLV